MSNEIYIVGCSPMLSERGPGPLRGKTLFVVNGAIGWCTRNDLSPRMVGMLESFSPEIFWSDWSSLLADGILWGYPQPTLWFTGYSYNRSVAAGFDVPPLAGIASEECCRVGSLDPAVPKPIYSMGSGVFAASIAAHYYRPPFSHKFDVIHLWACEGRDSVRMYADGIKGGSAGMDAERIKGENYEAAEALRWLARKHYDRKFVVHGDVKMPLHFGYGDHPENLIHEK